jgi:hypothetical protein
MLNLNSFVALIGPLITSFLGLLIRQALTLSKQRWASTIHFTLSAALLPPITFIITKVISGNIALSLGLVGALSIVRFRNPVKSSLELTIFFCLITVGIASSVALNWGIYLAIFASIVIISISYIKDKKYFKNIFEFNLSFDEGNPGDLIEVTSKSKIQILETNKNLINKVQDNNSKIFYYKLIINDKKEIDNIIKEIENNPELINYEYRAT